MATSFFIQKFLSLHFLAGMLKLVDKQDLGSCASCVWVRVPLPAQGDRFGKRRSFFLFPCKGPQAGGGDSYLQNGLRALTPGLSPAKKRKTAIQKDLYNTHCEKCIRPDI